MQSDHHTHAGFAVIGGGLAGLTAAIKLAQAGQPVTLFEKSRMVGGRAVSQHKDGYVFNLGPHALYRDGEGRQILEDMGIDIRGKRPPLQGHAYQQGKLHPLPVTPWALLSTPLLSGAEKWSYARAFMRLRTIDPQAYAGLTVSQWMDREIDPHGRQRGLRDLIAATIRLTTYADAPHLQDAPAALEQTKRGLNGGVLYLDGGWQQLVDQLYAVAQRVGVVVHTGAAVMALRRQEQGLTLKLADGSELAAQGVILAVDPDAAARLLADMPPATRDAWLPDAPPLEAATLDLALARPLRGNVPFVIGLDRPLYYSVHSRSAKLAPDGGALVQVAYYLSPEPRAARRNPQETRRAIESLLDTIDPEWQRAVVHERFLPALTVAHTLMLPEQLGRSRATLAAPGYEGVFVAGDWVGETSMLADAALHSAVQAAAQALAFARETASRLNYPIARSA